MRIAQIVPSLVVGGAETLVVQLSEAQQRAGHEVFLVCIREGGPLEARLPPTLQPQIVGKRSRFDLRVLPRLTRLLRRLRPDVVHTHIFTALSWGSVAARLARVPVVVHTQHQAHADDQAYLAAVRRLLARGVDQVVACSDGVETDILRRRLAPPWKVRTIENGIPLADRPRSELLGDPVHVGTVGRLVPVKGQRFLVQAVALLRDRGVPVRLTIAGGGELADALREQVDALGLADQVHLPGRVADVPQRLAGFDLFCLPSLSEGLPMSLLEACAAGLPVLITSGGGMKIVVERGAGGWVVPPGDPTALADAIEAYARLEPAERRVLGDRSLALVAAALRHRRLCATLRGPLPRARHPLSAGRDPTMTSVQ